MRRTHSCTGALVHWCTGALTTALLMIAGSAMAQQPLTMEQVVRVAVERHPAIREAAARVDEARGLAQQAGTGRNPVVGYLADDLGTANGAPAGKHGAFLEVPIALGGRLVAARVAGDALVASRESALEVVRRAVTIEAGTRWLAVAVAAQRAEAAASLATLTEEGVDIAGKLYNVGLIDRADVLDAEAAVAEARAHRDEARTALDAAWEQLANILGLPDLDRSRAPQLPDLPVLAQDEARARVLGSSPEREAARRDVAHQQALLSATHKAVWPDLTLKAEGWFDRERAGSGGAAKGWGFGAEAGIRLPLIDRNTGNILAAGAALRVAEAALARTEAETSDAFAQTWSAYAGAAARATALQTDVLPRAEEAYRLYLENFQQMSSPYPQVLMARERLIRTRQALVEALELAWTSWIRLTYGAPGLL